MSRRGWFLAVGEQAGEGKMRFEQTRDSANTVSDASTGAKYFERTFQWFDVREETRGRVVDIKGFCKDRFSNGLTE